MNHALSIQNRSPIFCSDEYKPMDEIIYDNKRAKVIVQEEVNTYIVSIPGRPQGTLLHKDQMRRVESDILNKDNKSKDGQWNQIINNEIPSCPHSPVQQK